MKGVDDHMSFRVSRNFMSAMLGIGSRSNEQSAVDGCESFSEYDEDQ